MTNERSSDITTVTVSGVGLAASPDGTATVVLHLKEVNAVAFKVNFQVIARLRQVLAEAEQILCQKPGQI
jgi:hypothetical protein